MPLRQEALDVSDERLAALGPAGRDVPLEPVAVQVVDELPREDVPGCLRQHVPQELANGVVDLPELVQERGACLRLVQLVVVGLRQQVVQHVLQHLLALQVVVLDVLALVALEALLERHDQQAAVHGLRPVAEPRQLVDALDHEPLEKDRTRLLELAVQLERVPRDDGLEGRRVVHEGARVVLVGDDCGDAHQRLKHERVGEVLQRDGLPGTAPEQVAHQGAERSLAVVARRGVQPGALVPADTGADDRSHQLPEQVHDRRTVRQLVHPGDDVPVGAVAVVVDDRVRRTLHEVHVALAHEHELGVESQKELRAVVVHAVVDGDQVGIGVLLDARADCPHDCLRLVYAAHGNRVVVAADEARQAVPARIVDALVDPAGLVDADVEIAVIARVLPQHSLRVVKLADDERNLERMQPLQDLVPLGGGLLVGVPLGELCTGRRGLVLVSHVVRADALVRDRREVVLQRTRVRRVVRIELRQVRDGRRRQQVVVGNPLGAAVIYETIDIAELLVSLTKAIDRAKTIINRIGRPGSCAGVGAVFFCRHVLHLPNSSARPA